LLISGLVFVDGRTASVLHGELSKRRSAGASHIVRRIWELCEFDTSLLDAA
jgi:hypothetical protein